MCVLHIAKQKLGTGVEKGGAHRRSGSKRRTPNAQRPIPKSDYYYGRWNRKHVPGKSIFGASAFPSKSGRAFVLFLANERKPFAFHYCPIDRDFGDVFTAR